MVMKMKVSPIPSLAMSMRTTANWPTFFAATWPLVRKSEPLSPSTATARKVVDLWGGHRNGITKEPRQEDTIVTVFSTTKGVSSVAVAVAASRVAIYYDAKVADYWPRVRRSGYRYWVRLRDEQTGFHMWSDPRELALRQSLLQDIVGARPQTYHSSTVPERN
jgi:CubicO group peptidase (beta-lactamase class C family)